MVAVVVQGGPSEVTGNLWASSGRQGAAGESTRGFTRETRRSRMQEEHRRTRKRTGAKS